MSSAVKIAGSAISALGQIREGYLQKAVADYQADWYMAQSREEGIRASILADKIKRAKYLMRGRQVAAYGKAGVRVGTGTPLEVMADTAAQYEKDLAINDFNMRVAQSRLRASARFKRFMGRESVISGYMSAASTLLSSYTPSPSGSANITSSSGE